MIADDIESLIASAAHKVGRRLRKKGLEGTTLHLKVRYENLKIQYLPAKDRQPWNQ